MGPGSFDPGSSQRNRTRSLQPSTFNGAGVFRPRKSVQYLALEQGNGPSMGPGSFDPRKYGSQPAKDQARWPLQWGRGLSTPEVWGGGRPPVRRRGPSMGPGSFDPGSSHVDTFDGRRPNAFNGAGVFRPRKFVVRRLRLGRGAGPSMGAGVFRPRKFRAPARPASRLPRPSMGPGSFDPGSAGLAERVHVARAAFNGAGVFRPRKCRANGELIAFSGTLQWGRGLSTPEVTSKLRAS